MWTVFTRIVENWRQDVTGHRLQFFAWFCTFSFVSANQNFKNLYFKSFRPRDPGINPGIGWNWPGSRDCKPPGFSGIQNPGITNFRDFPGLRIPGLQTSGISRDCKSRDYKLPGCGIPGLWLSNPGIFRDWFWKPNIYRKYLFISFHHFIMKIHLSVCIFFPLSHCPPSLCPLLSLFVFVDACVHLSLGCQTWNFFVSLVILRAKASSFTSVWYGFWVWSFKLLARYQWWAS